MRRRKHSGKDTSVTIIHTKKDISTGQLAPVMIGSANGLGSVVGSGNHPNSRAVLKPRPRKRKINAEIPHFFGGTDLYDGPLGPPIEDEEDDD
jgi:hypothetical protein